MMAPRPQLLGIELTLFVSYRNVPSISPSYPLMTTFAWLRRISCCYLLRHLIAEESPSLRRESPPPSIRDIIESPVLIESHDITLIILRLKGCLHQPQYHSRRLGRGRHTIIATLAPIPRELFVSNSQGKHLTDRDSQSNKRCLISRILRVEIHVFLYLLRHLLSVSLLSPVSSTPTMSDHELFDS